MEEGKVKFDKGAERRKLIGIGLIMLILIIYVVMLLNKVYTKQRDENRKQERVEQIIQKIEDELNN